MSIEVGQKSQESHRDHTLGLLLAADNKTGLVHISEVSDGYVKEISSVLTVSQKSQ